MKKTMELLGDMEATVARRGSVILNKHQFRAFKAKVMDMFDEEMPKPAPRPAKPTPAPAKKRDNSINLGEKPSEAFQKKTVKKAVKKATGKSK